MASIWFNARVLCCESQPQLALELQKLKARVSWAPLISGEVAPENTKLRTLAGDWTHPDHPYRLVEGHEVVILHWPAEACPAPHLRDLVGACCHLFDSARRSRVRALGLSYSSQSQPLNWKAVQFLQGYLESWQGPQACAPPEQILSALEALLALA